MTRTYRFLAFIVLLAFWGAASVNGAVFLKSDGKALNGFPDPEQALTIVTASGEVSLKLADVAWIAGQETVKIRLKKGGPLLCGKFVDAEWRLKKNPQDKKSPISLKLSEMAFFSGEETSVKEFEKMVVIEIAEGSLLFIKTQRDSKKTPFQVELYPQCWEGNLRLTKPVYKNQMRSNEEFGLGVTVRADADAYVQVKGLSEGETKKDLWGAVYLVISNATMHMRGRFSPAFQKGEAVDSQEYSQPLAMKFMKPFYMQFGNSVSEVVGNTNFYFYLCGETESLAKGNLKIEKTLSNILTLPLTIMNSR